MTDMIGTGIRTRKGLRVEIFIGYSILRMLTQLRILSAQSRVTPAGKRRACGFESCAKRNLVQ